MSERLDTEEKRLEVAVQLVGLEISLLSVVAEDLRGTPRLEAVGVFSENVPMASSRESLSSPASAAPDFSSRRTGVLGKCVSSGNGITGGIIASGIVGLEGFTTLGKMGEKGTLIFSTWATSTTCWSLRNHQKQQE